MIRLVTDTDTKDQTPPRLVEGEDYYVDASGLFVFTGAYLKRRGFCCHQGCRHCPYQDDIEGPSEKT